MLRLSIIVPYRHDDSQLEGTVLSVLENRPDGSELIVVHDGTYSDPYDLADELSLIEFPAGTAVVSMLNRASELAAADNVCTLLDGVKVAAGWADAPLAVLEDEGADVVAVQVQRGQQSTFGLSRQALKKADSYRSGRLSLTEPRGASAGPTLDCGFFCRDSLLAIGGWCEQLSERAAEVEMGLLLVEAEWQNHCIRASGVTASTAPCLSVDDRTQLAALATCYGVAQQPGFFGRASELISGCLTGTLAQRRAWLAGLQVDIHLATELEARRRAAAELADIDIAEDRHILEFSKHQAWRKAA